MTLSRCLLMAVINNSFAGSSGRLDSTGQLGLGGSAHFGGPRYGRSTTPDWRIRLKRARMSSGLNIKRAAERYSPSGPTAQVSPTTSSRDSSRGLVCCSWYTAQAGDVNVKAQASPYLGRPSGADNQKATTGLQIRNTTASTPYISHGTRSPIPVCCPHEPQTVSCPLGYRFTCLRGVN